MHLHQSQATVRLVYREHRNRVVSAVAVVEEAAVRMKPDLRRVRRRLPHPCRRDKALVLEVFWQRGERLDFVQERGGVLGLVRDVARLLQILVVQLEHRHSGLQLVAQEGNLQLGVEHHVPRPAPFLQLHLSLGNEPALYRIYLVRKDGVQAQVRNEERLVLVGLGDAAVRVRPALAEGPVLLARRLRALHVLRGGLHQHLGGGAQPPARVHGHQRQLGVPVAHQHHPVHPREQVGVAGRLALCGLSRNQTEVPVCLYLVGGNVSVSLNAFSGDVQQVGNLRMPDHEGWVRSHRSCGHRCQTSRFCIEMQR
mmetsp:Transcript_17358/g.33155  ORF Transcript_17358/g.33155 Transcript_17358/m.33155 type:complete len:311 (-) Transcript_17358:425-1357(-)